MQRASDQRLRSEGVPLARDPVCLRELSFDPLEGEPPSDSEVLTRLGRPRPLGAFAVTEFGEAYRLAEYLRRFTAEPIRFAMDMSQVARILADRISNEHPGRLLEVLGRLLAFDVKMYAYPTPAEAIRAVLGPAAELFRVTASGAGVVTADDLSPMPPLEHLYRYLRDAGWVIPIGGG
jgi:hypothetical protein